MTKFVSLTESCGNDLTKPILINVAYIQRIQTGARGKDVHIRMSDNSFYFVRESFEQIEKLIAANENPYHQEL